MPFATAQAIEDFIIYILNAAQGGYGTAVVAGIRKANPDNPDENPIAKARRFGSMEVLRAIASYPKGGYFGELSELITVEHNDQMPAYDGEPGIPLIVPFSDADPIDGLPASPNEIDSYRLDPTNSIYTGLTDGVRVAHNEATDDNLPSPISCRYSIVGGRFKFTGFSAQIPLITIDDTMIDEKIPLDLMPTVVKLAIPMSVKPGDNLYQIAPMYAQMGQQDLLMIKGGEMQVPPVPILEVAQKARVL